ncbi:MAG TPA: zinc-binding alcohol dehydrogenase family protein [Solirubrobacterales bacterium]|nr:zinc-binding alcohol dehydrogenase family protein [Solirubrobacterales bacterium]
MKAAVVTGYGDPPEYRDFAPPEPADGTELLEVELAGLNPVDVAIASGKFDAGAPPLPYVTGTEAVGRDADGRRVWSDEARYPSGSLAEWSAIGEGSGVELPDEISSEQAIAFGVAGVAAWLALTWRGGLVEGETVLVNGASGAVGQIAVQAARLLGAGRVVGSARSESGRSKVDALGADAVVDTGSEKLVDDLREATGGGADLVIDNLWGTPAVAAIEAMNPRGRLIQVGNSAGTGADILAGRLRGGLIDIRGHRNFWASREERADAFQTMCRHSIEGDLKIEVEVIPLAEVADAWERQKASPGHKLALRPR